MSPPSFLLFTKASLADWGTHFLDLTAVGVWSQEEKELYINILEMNAFRQALDAFLDTVVGGSVVLMSDNDTFVSYLKKQGETVSKTLYDMAQEIVLWTEVHSVTLSARYIPGKNNVLAVAHSPRPGPSH